MTDLPFSSDDEIVSAVLDGEATEVERALVEADPELRRRLAEFRQVHEAVARPVAALDEFTSRRVVDQALALADGESTLAGPDTGSSGRPAPLRPKRPWWQSGAGIGLGSAAALVLLALLAGPAFLDGLGGDDDSADMASTSADDSAEPNLLLAPAESGMDGTGDMAADEAEGGETADQDDAMAGVAGAEPVESIGTFGSTEAFSEAALDHGTRVVEEYDADPSSPTTTIDLPSPTPEAAAARSVSNCPASVFDDVVELDDVVQVVSGEVDGRVLIALAVVSPEGAVSVVVIDPSTCELLELD